MKQFNESEPELRNEQNKDTAVTGPGVQELEASFFSLACLPFSPRPFQLAMRVFRGLCMGPGVEKDLRKVFPELMSLPEGEKQTALAVKLFGRAAALNVLAIVKEAEGDVDQAIMMYLES